MKNYKIAPHAVMAICLIIEAVIYSALGNTSFRENFGNSAFVWLYHMWTDATGSSVDFSHGPVVVIVSAAMIWSRRHNFLQGIHEKTAGPASILAIAIAISLHWLGLRAQYTPLSLFGLVLLLWAIPTYIYGVAAGRTLMFPCMFLLFAIPWPFLEMIAFPLRQIAATAATAVTNGIGISAARQGTAIFLTGSTPLALEIADPCSGLRSLMAICALTAGYSYFVTMRTSHKVLLCLLSIPIAVIANIVRIVTITVIATLWSSSVALAVYHDLSGYIVIFVATVIVVSIGSRLADFHRMQYSRNQKEIKTS